jgi:uncharacterized membrane protein YkvA (DUF1232 family)
MGSRTLSRLKSIGHRFKSELKVYQGALRDPRTPRLARLLLWLAIGYTLLPFDLIPDFIPIIGHLDDAILVPLLIMGALKLIPETVMKESRDRVFNP